ncbi:MAG TPA: sigma-70 family RNA polymerase sigma factor [Vicinamibacterales bacterium]|nr:sigma-70 family RNA polymerase sigma factor [Vicinamibacterales bacterium]
MTNRWLDGLTVSEETSLSLLARAKQGDAVALEALMGRYLTRLQRWASGRIPSRARSLLDTDDIVQDALLNTFRCLDTFQPRHDGALLAYLREAVANRIKNELRRVVPDIEAVEFDNVPSAQPSPLDRLLSRESLDRYERALAQLSDDDRAAIVGRFEMSYSYDALARATQRATADAARKLTERALRRLIATMDIDGR